MPLYEYHCNDCQTTFEALRSMSKADTPIQCKNCQSGQTSRVLSLFAAHVKGGSSSAALSGGSGGCGGSCTGCSGGCGCGH